MAKAKNDESDYARIVRELEQKRSEWDLAKSGAKTPEQQAAVDKRYGENIKLMERERDAIQAARPGQAKLQKEFRSAGKEMTSKEKGHEPG
jgi:hypothetical protein